MIKLAQNVDSQATKVIVQDIEPTVTGTINIVYYSLLGLLLIWFIYLAFKMIKATLKVRGKEDTEKNKKTIEQSSYRMLTVLALAAVVFTFHFIVFFTTG